MKKPEDNESNLKKCICEKCGFYINMVCAKGEKEEGEKLYCARKPSKCKMGRGMCYCPGCDVYVENKLAGYAFCIEEIKNK